MNYAGIDIGSRTTELALVDDTTTVVLALQTDTGFDPMAGVRKLLEGVEYDAVLATGYGRGLFEIAFDAPTVTEIKALARGVRELFPGVPAVLDIGGQDSKAISLFENGRVKKFEMNDRCAAGTGKFLEVMAKTLGYQIEEFGDEALQAKNEIDISSMCTVFAESEVISLVAKGADRGEIAHGLHVSAMRRALGMVSRVSDGADLVFAGGVAKNACMRALLEKHLSRKVLVPNDPQTVCALGAALLARESVIGASL
ncbi:MAG TPA: acyl-CoA dehydratase activase [Fimbriimonadaceae bacterium]|nr:acyl-CoA dehydratase activase [Fimbriimonadaceae bacterium]